MGATTTTLTQMALGLMDLVPGFLTFAVTQSDRTVMLCSEEQIHHLSEESPFILVVPKLCQTQELIS